MSDDSLVHGQRIRLGANSKASAPAPPQSFHSLWTRDPIACKPESASYRHT